VLLVFFIGNILVDKNTLCIDSFQSLHVIWTVSHFMPCVGHKGLEDVHEYSMKFSNQNSQFLYSLSNEPLKASGRPSVSRSFRVVAVWTTEQHRPDVLRV
jgi:hypothetical protein